MLVSHQERPRELRWYHAGPLLYGDWGTSRFYVLGLALAFSLHASFWYVLAVGLIVAAVGWAYTIICRCYPDVGGVYSAARHTSRSLAVVGALLLFADYIVTAALSACAGLRYMGVAPVPAAYWAMFAILVIGLINYIGPRKAGAFALIITLATLVLTLVLTAFSIPHLGAGWQAITHPTGSVGHQWNSFVYVILALSGVEAIANMTGIMVPPVARTAKKAIWPVLCEVVVFNLILAVAMNALPMDGLKYPPKAYEKAEEIRLAHPDLQTPAAQAQIAAEASNFGVKSPQEFAALTRTDAQAKFHKDAEDSVLRVMAEAFVTGSVNARAGVIFGWICGIVFGLLLVSAANTAIADMISIQYVMSRDTELPHFFTKLNAFGVPWIALLPAVIVPILLLTLFQNIDELASLYAIGVVGAICINLGSCSISKDMPLKKYERIGMFVLALLMAGIELTLAWDKPAARYFALAVVAGGLIMRFSTKTYPKLSEFVQAYVLSSAAFLLIVASILVAMYSTHISAVLATFLPLLHTPQTALIFIIVITGTLLIFAGSFGSTSLQKFRRAGLFRRVPKPVPVTASVPTASIQGTPPQELDMDRPHVMVATRGGQPLMEFAASYAKDVRGILFVLFVRQLNIAFTGPSKPPTLDEDAEARTVFAMAAEKAKQAGVPIVPMYIVSPDIAYSILDFAATYSVKALLMGVSRKGTLLRALQGDVITNVADNLPQDIPLLIHA